MSDRTTLEARIADLEERQADCQSQRDALCGECPEVAHELTAQIDAFDRLLQVAYDELADIEVAAYFH